MTMMTRFSNARRCVRLLVTSVFAVALCLLAATSPNLLPGVDAEDYATCDAHEHLHHQHAPLAEVPSACPADPADSAMARETVAFNLLSGTPQNGGSVNVALDAARKRKIERECARLRRNIENLNGNINNALWWGRRFPDMAYFYQDSANFYRKVRDLDASQLKELEAVLINWNTWGRQKVIQWEQEAAAENGVPNQSAGSFSSGSLNSQRGQYNQQKKTCYLCNGRGTLSRMCGRCSGSGRIQKTVGEGTTSCYNCSGSGRVDYSCQVCSGAGYTWTN